MSVWLCIPSARPPEEAGPTLAKWAERGYRIALVRDVVETQWTPYDYVLFSSPTWGKYPGYAVATNQLIKEVLAFDSACDFVVAGGDDVEPDLNHSAEEIARECKMHFYSNVAPTINERLATETFGVMQPTGDRWGENAVPGLQGAYIDRVCGSPWMGREFCRRMYQGNGPLYSGYRHMFEDEELQNVAQRLGVLWQRPDLTHHHRHWGRKRGATEADCPDFLRDIAVGEAGRKHWAESRALFETRKAGNFPGHEPIA